MRLGLYLGDLRRTKNDSHGIVNYAVGLTRALAEGLEAIDSLHLLVGREIAEELGLETGPGVVVDLVDSPTTERSRLVLDHVTVNWWAHRTSLDVLHFPKGFMPLVCRRPPRIVATLHDDIPAHYANSSAMPAKKRIKMAYFSAATHRTLRRADWIITVSEFSARQLRARQHDVDDRLSVVPNGVTLPLRTPRRRSEKDLTLLHLGSVLPHKRSDQLLTWMRPFLNARPEYRLVVTGALSETGERLCKHEAISRRPEPLPASELGELISGARAMLFPSVLEGFGLPPVEAACLGTPSVWADASAVSEVMRGCPGGFQPDNQESFYRALEEALSTGDSLMASAAEQFRTRYSWREVARRTHDVYRALDNASPRDLSMSAPIDMPGVGVALPTCDSEGHQFH